jgi:5,5'-dehydrodivanillate O-demethylase
VPADDTHTMHLWYTAYVPPKGMKVAPELLDKVHVYDVPLKGADGEYIMDNIDGQDMAVWCTQGPIADRTKENLGASDNGIALYRRVLRREIKKVEEGVDPMFTFRDKKRTSASTCRTSARSITTAKARGAGSCARTRPIRRSPRM